MASLARHSHTKISAREAIELDKDRLQREAIQRILIRRGVDLNSVAERLGVKNNELHKWFEGRLRFSTKQLQRIVKIATPTPLRKERENSAAAAQHRILERIKAKPNLQSVKRVMWLLDMLRKAEELRTRLYEASEDHLLVNDRPGDPWAARWVSKSNSDQPAKYDPDLEIFTDPQLQEMDLQFKKTMKEIDRHLRRYRWTPTVRCGGFAGLSERHIWTQKSKDEDWENWAVLWLIKHATHGSGGLLPSLILRFRNCRRCQTLFYALTDFQEFCTTSCRKKFYSEQKSSTPESRAKHALEMRDFRQRKKEKERSEDEAVKRAWERDHTKGAIK